MIDKDLIINKEDYIKSDFLNSLRSILNDTNKNNIDNNILAIKNKLEEFNILNESNFNIDDTIINKDYMDSIIKLIKNTKYYNLDKTSFINLKEFIKDVLITIGAESSVGKTSFATQLSLDILNNNEDTILAFYSLDDSKFFLTKKMISYLLKDYNQSTDKELVKLINDNKNKSLKLLTSERIAVFEQLNIYNLYSQLIKFKKNAQDKLNIKSPRLIVVIDYLQIIDHESNNLREGLNKTCKDLKDIQKKLNCMMFLLSQFNRSKDNNVNTLIRYRETSEIENISDICMNLESIKNSNKYNIKLYIVKNKTGEKDKEFVSFRNSYNFDTFKYDDSKKYIKSIDFNSNNNYNNNEEFIEDYIF